MNHKRDAIPAWKYKVGKQTAYNRWFEGKGAPLQSDIFQRTHESNPVISRKAITCCINSILRFQYKLS